MGKRIYIYLIVFLGIVPALWADITSVTVNPNDPSAGISNTHTVQFFITATNPPPDNGRLVVDYSTNGFNLINVYIENPAGHNLPVSVNAYDSGNEVIVQLLGAGSSTIPSGWYTMNLRSMGNTETAGDYYVHMKAQDNGGIDVGTGVNSSNFTITPGPVASYVLAGIPASRQAGQAFGSNITATAYDQYNNLKTNYSGPVTWTSTDPYPADLPTDDGSGWSGGQKTFAGSSFVLYTISSQSITVTDNSIPAATETSSSITVTQANLNNYVLFSSTPQAAGVLFPLQVTNAQDSYGNPWTGTVAVSVLSGGGNAPRGDSPTISDISVSGGAGFADQMLTNATNTVFQGVGDGILRTTGSIVVMPGQMDDFVLSATSPQTAGIGFAITITGALDTLWNPWSGVIAVNASTGGNNAPDGTPPTINDITVIGGSGSATQTLTRSETTVLHGQTGSLDRYTGSLTVNPGVLAEFDMTGYPSAITAGEIFPSFVGVTAYDAFRNVKTDYLGQVYFQSMDPQVQFTYHSGNPYTFVAGENGTHNFAGAAFQLRTAGAQKIIVRDDAPNPDVLEESNSIIVGHANISDFSLSLPDGNNPNAGVAFRLAVNGARDQYGNGWSGTVNVSAVNGGGVSPNGANPIFNPISVSNQTGQAYQVLVNAESGVVLQAQANGVTRTTPALLIDPNPFLSYIQIRDGDNGGGDEVGVQILTIGSSLTVYAAGYDAYGNYSGNVYSNWISSGLTPPVIGNNIPEITFVPTQTGSGSITATDYATGTIFDHTGTIMVQAGAVSGFEIDPIASPHEMGQPFIIGVTAVDASGVRVNNFTGRVVIYDSTNTIQPDTSSGFIDGYWTGGVTIFQSKYDDRITVKQVNGSALGVSNVFDVIPTTSIQIDSIVAVLSDTLTPLASVTIGQERDWFIKMFVRNIGSTSLTLEETELQFVVNGSIETDYTLDLTDTFWGNGTSTLGPGAIDSLLLKIDRTGQNAGPSTVYGTVRARNFNGDLLSTQSWVTLAVQTSANVIIEKIRPSQPEVSQNQEEDWTLTVIMKNHGGSAVVIDSIASSTTISFSRGTGWVFARPDSFFSGGWVLSGGETDSLLFSVQKTGNGPAGTCVVHGVTSGIEENTGNTLGASTETQGFGYVGVQLERPADFHILSVVNNAPNAPYVDVGQSFTVQVDVVNAGDDGIYDAQILMRSNGNSLYLPTIPIPDLAGGASYSVNVNIDASYLVNVQEVFTFEASGQAQNTKAFTGSEERNLSVVIQNVSILSAGAVETTIDSALGGQIDPWQVKVTVYNNGQAGFLFDTPQARDLAFLNDNIAQTDYKIDPPSSLKSGGLILGGGFRDTLIYTVQATGRLGGDVQIRARISGHDQNSLMAQTDSSNGSIYIKSEKDFRIVSMYVVTHNQTEAGNGIVNIGQDLKIRVCVENGLGETLNQIKVRLGNDGISAIDDTLKLISRLKPSEVDTVEFQITASSIEHLDGEVFSADIFEAFKEGTGLPAYSGPALDSTAIVFIQNPADIALSVELENPLGQFSVGQEFTVSAHIYNSGTSGIDNSGRVRIVLPANYILLSIYDSSAISLTSPAQWTVKAPSIAQPLRELTVVLYQYPNDVNIGSEAMVSEPQAIVNISTISSSLEAGLGITAPEGARDRIVSTDQNFIVLANFQMHNVSNVKAKITLPVGYSTNENLEKNVVGSIVTWQVVAPSESQALSLIYLDANGVDALQPNVSVIAKTQTIDVTTINAAELVLTLSIISPDDAVDGTVSPGQEFVIQAELQNTGEAGITGQAVVSLSDLPEGYTIKGDEVLSKILVENFATWEIQAPVQATGTATIEARLTTVPQDENTNVSAKLGRGNDKIGVTVESAWLAVSTLPLPTDMSRSATVGQSWTKLMILEMDNRGEVGANRIRLESITFNVEDMYNDEISPRDVFSRLYIVNDEDSTQLFGSRSPLPNQNPVMVSLSQLLISTDTNMKLAIVGEITEDKGETYFQLNIPSAASIIAKDLDTGIDVLVADGTGEDFLNLRSLPQRIYDPDTEPLLWNSPNPFGQPGKEETQISFYINKLTSVDLKLFTLTGKLVWSQSLSQDLLEGSIGTTYQVTWDGRNDNQHMVLNGVYLLFLKMGDGEVRRTKIAVIK